MHLTGVELRAVLSGQSEAVEVRDGLNRILGTIGPTRALEVVRGGWFAGVGNPRRIHHIKPDTTAIEADLIERNAAICNQPAERSFFAPLKWQPPQQGRDQLIKKKKPSKYEPHYVGTLSIGGRNLPPGREEQPGSDIMARVACPNGLPDFVAPK